jgi:creatinine amidohydrolase/Fe(II)-dependent formamide hydrolase-like protein
MGMVKKISRITLLSLGILALSALSAQAGPLPSVFVEDLTWKEVDAALKSGMRTVIIPTGGTEQNGEHMITGKHNYIVRYTAQRIAQGLGDALVAPVMAYVPEEGHMAYPGTISLSVDTFERVLTDAATSFRRHGFTLICFVGDSGDQQAAQQVIADKLSRDWAKEGVRVLNVSDYYDEHNGQDAWMLTQGEKLADIRGHASLSDTSELLVAHPEGVRKNLLTLSPNQGPSASPAHASAAYGQKLLELKVAAAIHQIRHAPPVAEAPGWRSIFSFAR